MKIDTLRTERQKLQNELNEEVAMARSEYMPRINALTFQINRMKPGKKNHDIAKTVKQFSH